MKDSITTLLNDLSARLDCDMLTEGETEKVVSTQLTKTQHRIAAAAEEVRQLADPDDALAFAEELSTFIADARAKALEANKLREAINKGQVRLVEAQDELRYLSAGRAALAKKVNSAMLALEQAKREYADNEQSLGFVERNVEAIRLERSELRRQLDELTRRKEETN